jgi:two-component system, sensor histidine kinase
MLPSDLVRSAFDSAPDAMVIIDASGAIVFANRQVTSLFGYDTNEIAGQPVEVLLPERFRDRHARHRQGYAENVRVRPMGIGLDLFALRKNGSEFPVEISLSPMTARGEVLTAAAIRDVTDRRATEAQLKEAREAADRANQAKSRFLATASHDLRQPLQTLALLNGALRRMIGDPEPAEVLAQAEHAISAMSRLLNALLDISKLESGAIKPEVTDFTVAAIFTELRTEFAGLAAAKGLRLDVEPCTDCVHSDPSLIEQVLRNLVSNAIKYTRLGCVRLRCLHDGAFVRLEVLDTGIGIPAEALAHIYDEFYQVDVPANSSREGYGLGLSIVQRIMKLLGHKLEVRSELGKGSQFSLKLPRGSQTEARAHAPNSTERSARQRTNHTRHILLVEDNPGVRTATQLLLVVEGYRVTAAASLAEAARVAAEHPDIELLVTDYHLTNAETGVQVIAAVRRQLATDVRTVLITGDTSSAVRALQHDERLRITSKPIDADELLSVLRELLAA